MPDLEEKDGKWYWNFHGSRSYPFSPRWLEPTEGVYFGFSPGEGHVFFAEDRGKLRRYVTEDNQAWFYSDGDDEPATPGTPVYKADKSLTSVEEAFVRQMLSRADRKEASDRKLFF